MLQASEVHFFGEVDYLLWFAHQEGLSYATRSDVDLVFDFVNDVARVRERDLFFKHPFRVGNNTSLRI